MKGALVVLAIGCGTSDARLPSGAGGVTLQVFYGTPAFTSIATASFSQGDTVFTCDRSVVAGCKVASNCGVPSFPPLVGFGEATVDGTTPPLDLTDSSTLSFSSPLFEGGETLTFASTGDRSPPFDATMIAPSKVTVSGPTIRPAPDADLPITWTPPSAGQLIVSLNNAAPSQPATTFVDCFFDGSAGQAVVPGAVRTLGTSAGVSTQNEVDVTVDGWDVGGVADIDAVAPDGSPSGTIL